MSRERFSSSVVPQTPGSIDEIRARIPIGQKRMNDLIQKEIEERNEARKEFIYRNNIRNRKQIRNRGRRLSKKDEGTLDRWYPLAKLPIDAEFHLDLTDRIPADQKKDLFTPAAEAMIALAKDHKVILPAPETLVSRLYFVDNKTLHNLHLQEVGQDSEGIPLGFCLNLDRLSFIDYDALLRYKTEEEKEKYLKTVGIHELWEGLAYKELWTPLGQAVSNSDNIRRKGFVSQRAFRAAAVTGGMHRLKEGFVDYLSRETFARAGFGEPLWTSYGEELEIVDMIVKKTGDDPFFQGFFTKHGFINFYRALESTFGKGAYKKIGEKMWKDYNENTMNALICDEGEVVDLSYRLTKEFLNSI